MYRITESYEENVRETDRVLRVDENFDLIRKVLRIGQDEMTFYYVDGFVKDGVMQKLMLYFLSLQGIGDGADAAQSFLREHIPYVESEVCREPETLLHMVLSGATIAFGSTFGACGIVIDARSYINSHYAERITLDDLSRSISINKFYLQKLFKRCIGLSPNEYLIHTRLTRAKQLLRNSSHPISQIAMDVGISNIGHFISLFKRYEGITPSAYRQRWYNSDGDSNAADDEE